MTTTSASDLEAVKYPTAVALVFKLRDKQVKNVLSASSVGLPWTQARDIVAIGLLGQFLPMSGIARLLLGNSTGPFTEQVNLLMKYGDVVEYKQENALPGTYIRLTDKGREVYQKAMKALEPLFAQV